MTISVQESMRSLITHNGVTAAYSFTFQVESADEVRVHVKTPTGSETELVNPTDFTVALGALVPGGTVTLVSPSTYPNLSVIRISRSVDPIQPTALANTGGHFPSEVERALDRIVKLVQEVKARSDGSLATDFTDAGSFDGRFLRIKNLDVPQDAGDAATREWVLERILEAEASGGNIASLSALASTLLVQTTASAWLDNLGFSALGKTLAAVASAAAARTAIGASATGSAIIAAADGQAAMQAMGIDSTVAAALDAATSLASLLTELEIPNLIPYENGIINGDFQVWQTGTSRTGATTVPNSDGNYFADQWFLLSDGNDQVDIAASSSLGYAPGCFGVADFEVVGAGKWGFAQFAESARSVPLRGKTVCVVLSGARTATLQDMRCHLVSWSGTADAPTRDFISAWGTATGKPTAIAGATLVDASGGTSSTFALNLGSYTQHYFFFTVPANCNNLGIFIGTDDASYSAGDRVAFGGIGRSIATAPTPFQSRGLAAELAECERFFAKTFAMATVPASSAGLAGALMDIARNTGGDPFVSAHWQFRHRMRKSPTITTYNPEAGGSGWEQVGGSQTFAATVESEGDSGCHIYGSASGSAGERYAIHATADARF